jgi:hypothetical protein
MKAQIITPWTGDGKAPATAYRPLLADRYHLAAWSDVTGSATPSDPNLVVIETDLDQLTLDAITADPDFCILWSDI